MDNLTSVTGRRFLLVKEGSSLCLRIFPSGLSVQRMEPFVGGVGTRSSSLSSLSSLWLSLSRGRPKLLFEECLLQLFVWWPKPKSSSIDYTIPIIQWDTKTGYKVGVMYNMLVRYLLIYSRLSRCFTARGVTSRDPPKGIRPISF